MLAVLSFVCAVFLAVFISVQRTRTSIPRLSIVLWLFSYNLIHGINALIWSGNVDIRVPVWCDIATNFILGVNVALPAALLCVSLQLELLSSMRTISSHPTVVRNRWILEICMCYLLPILYILLHLVIQDHRFDLVENFGCSTSIDPSVVGISLMWIPPLLICSISIICFALSIRNSFHHGSMHLESRSTITFSSFFRSLVIYMATTIIASLVYLFCSFFGPPFRPWSWKTVHASMSEIDIVTSQSDEMESIRLAWWGGFVITVLYLLLSICLGDEVRDIFKWVKKQAAREQHFVLPIHASKNAPFSLFKKMTPQSPSSRSRPLTFELRSGWDDMLNAKVPKAKKNALPTTISACSSLTPTISTVITEDEVFMTSTFSYLGSPQAKNLGLSGSSVPRSGIPPIPRVPPSLPLPAPPATAIPSLPASCYVSRSGSCSSLTSF